MKKFIISVLSLSILLSLCACTKSDDLGLELDETTLSNTDTTIITSSMQNTDTTVDATLTTQVNSETTTRSIISSTTTSVPKVTIPPGTKVEVTTGTDGKPVDSGLKGSLGKILKSDKYTMSFDMQMDQNGVMQTVPITAHVSGKKTALETSMAIGAEPLKVTMLSTGTDFYLVIPSMKGYAKLPADEFNNMFPNVINTNDKNVKYMGTTKVNFEGKSYICETYNTVDSTTKYYFIDGKLKRIEITGNDGTTSILENVVYSSTVDESVFALPKGYMDLTALLSGLAKS